MLASLKGNEKGADSVYLSSKKAKYLYRCTILYMEYALWTLRNNSIARLVPEILFLPQRPEDREVPPKFRSSIVCLEGYDPLNQMFVGLEVSFGRLGVLQITINLIPSITILYPCI